MRTGWHRDYLPAIWAVSVGIGKAVEERKLFLGGRGRRMGLGLCSKQLPTQFLWLPRRSFLGGGGGRTESEKERGRQKTWRFSTSLPEATREKRKVFPIKKGEGRGQEGRYTRLELKEEEEAPSP